MEKWLIRSFVLWLTCKIAAILFWSVLVGIPLSILLVWVIAGILK